MDRRQDESAALHAAKGGCRYAGGEPGPAKCARRDSARTHQRHTAARYDAAVARGAGSHGTCHHDRQGRVLPLRLALEAWFYNTPYDTPLIGTIWDGFYIGVDGGASFVPTVMATEFFPDGKDRFACGSSIGSYFGAQAGLQRGNWRFEGQYTWSVNPAAATMPLPPDVKIGGDTETFGFFGNVIYTPSFTLGIPVTPHIGVGFGALNVTTTIKVNDMRVFDSSNWAPGAQAIGGLTWQISPRFSLDLNYRYQTSLGDVDYKSLTGSNKVTAPYHSSYVTLDLNLHFPSAPPPPPPPPAGAIPQARQFASLVPVETAAAARRFTLRYDAANAVLTPASVRSLHDALDAVEAGQDVRIAIAGCETGADLADGSPCARHTLRLRHLLARYGVENPGRLLAGG
jgi:opacity protein-like surface antigen